MSSSDLSIPTQLPECCVCSYACACALLPACPPPHTHRHEDDRMIYSIKSTQCSLSKEILFKTWDEKHISRFLGTGNVRGRVLKAREKWCVLETQPCRKEHSLLVHLASKQKRGLQVSLVSGTRFRVTAETNFCEVPSLGRLRQRIHLNVGGTMPWAGVPE